MKDNYLARFKNISSENELSTDIQKSLWQDYKGNWERAHELAQKKEGHTDYDRIHAYLHRKEGDKFNAGWWYRQLNLPYPTISLEKEWEELVEQYK
ncbi:hypothetical protein [Arcticibacterium luteifluviistationis]|uniref:Uncharacterized protein n=1 Tax=Arcticibacterium luteifluviistationis TaxID=1784714 RepID=A0A2Z4G857_9BACT|nr:hypothetical protein [Arcticibacterium luteifluviistationis]AWV97258.1 hypothetical protein DJ013_03360 [Arcticibacterium luteifluviistationis]